MTMVNRGTLGLLVLVLLAAALAGPLGAGQAAVERQIVQLPKPPVIDGDLGDWAGIEELAVDQTPEGRRLPASADLTVSARLAFDADNLYAAVRVIDDRLVAGDRRVQDGDALDLTLVDPEPAVEGRRYSTWAFSVFRGEPIKRLAGRNGKANPAAFVKDIQLKVVPAEDKKSVVYEIAIPWRYITDFRPFLRPVWGINLAYTDDDETVRKTAQLIPDPGFDDVHSGLRKGQSVRFVPGEPAAPQFQALLGANHYFPGQEKIVNLAIQSPSPQSGWQLVMLLGSPEGNSQSKKSLAFGRGLSVLRFPIEIVRPVWGVYDFSLALLDEKGAVRFSHDQQFFMIEPPELEAVAAKVAELKKGDLYAKDEVFRESLPTLEIRLKWTQDFMTSSDPYADIDSLRQWNGEIKELLQSLEAGRPALFPPGRAAALGYRSPVDGALRSYTVSLPLWFDRGQKLPMFVTLGGGVGEAERNVALLEGINLGPRLGRRAGDLVFMEPSTELAKGWYAGDAGREIMAGIAHLKKLYGINDQAVILDGFDRGAYGALRLALLNPGAVRGVSLRSGRYIPPDDSGAENLFELLDRAAGLAILMVHGAEDETAPVAEARAVADRLAKLGGRFKYLEVKDGAHTDYDRWSEIFSWVEDVLGRDKVTIKPPRKPKEKEEQDDDRGPEPPR